MSNDFATTNVDTIDQGDGNDTLIFTASNQTQSGDVFVGGTGTDTILVATGINFLPYLVGLSGGFFGYEAIALGAFAFARFSANQFGAGLISNSLHLTGANGTSESIIVDGAQNFSAAHWMFTNWETTDLIEIFGNNAGNVLTGSSQGDLIIGSGGADVLTGGRGQDYLEGDAGNDIFRFVRTTDSRVSNPDRITDFSHLEGDRIDLHKSTPIPKLRAIRRSISSVSRPSTTRPASCTSSREAHPVEPSRAMLTGMARPTSRSRCKPSSRW